MEKLRALVTQHPSWQGILEIIYEIEEEFDSKPHLSVGKTKSLIESICRTILDRSSHEYSTKWDFPKLIKETVKYLDIETVYNPDIRQAFVLLMGSLSHVRNNFDDRAHGHSLEWKLNKLDSISNSLIIASSEAFSCFFIEFYEENFGKSNNLITEEEKEKFYDYLDDKYGNTIVAGIPYSTSDVLPFIDETAYKDKYQEFKDWQLEAD